MRKEARTYEELLRQRNCLKITKYYNIKEEQLQEIYEFLTVNKSGIVRGYKNEIELILEAGVSKTINATCIDFSINSFRLSNNGFEKHIDHNFFVK